MGAAYAGLARFAAWVHESDRAMAAELELASPDWDEYLSGFELSRGLLAGADLTYHTSARYRASQTDRRGAHE
jgi:hypothetical protein